MLTCDIIHKYAALMWRKTHALMREVAHLEWGNFRGVCPILNRAKESGVHKGNLRPNMYIGEAIRRPELTVTPAISGFIMCCDEKHGALYVLPAN